jgi:hypothetical protein
MKWLALCLILFPAWTVSAAEPARPGALSRIFLHRDGTRTETEKNGNATEWKELTYNKDNILIGYRVYNTDSKGRPRNGRICDGKKQILATVQYGYDPATDQIVEERTFNNEGKVVRRLFYPGALKDPRFAKRFVAFNYDPNRPEAKPVADLANVKSTQPIQTELDEFQPGVPMGSAANQPTTPNATAAPKEPAKKPRPMLLQQRKRTGQ